jgi:hypothetical protein
MTVITTVAELDAMADDARVRDNDGDVWRKLTTNLWSLINGAHRSPGLRARRLVDLYGPLTLVVPPELHMTRCCGFECATTAPLPPGSTFLCPEHGAEHHTIKRGNS